MAETSRTPQTDPAYQENGIVYMALAPTDWAKFVDDGQPLTLTEGWCAAEGELDLTWDHAANLYFVFYPAQCGQAGLLDPDSNLVRYGTWFNQDYRSRLGRMVKDGKGVIKIDHLRYLPNPSDIPRNDPEYACYLDALNDPSIVAVIVTGAAGTGKSYAAFRYGYLNIHDGTYMSAIVAKEGRNEMGAVKGGVEEKMAPIIAFAMSNLGSILIDEGKLDDYFEEPELHPGNGTSTAKHRKIKVKQSGKTANQALEELVAMEWKKNWSAKPYRYLAGCSLRHTFYLLDEFQRVSIDDADTLVTRIGDGSKMVILGDVAQIERGTDIRRAVNGLTYATALLRGSPQAAHIHLRVNLRHGLVDWIVRHRDAVRQAMGIHD